MPTDRVLKIKNLIKNPLAWGSFVMLAGSTVSNFANYLFNLFMGRSLGPEGYGILAALISVLAIVSVPSATLGTTIVKFSSGFKARNEIAKLALLTRSLSLFFLGVGLVLFLFFYFGRAAVGAFLKIPSASPIVVLGALFLIAFPAAVNAGVLMGLQRFSFLSLNSIFAGAAKLLLGVFFVYLGLAVNGAMLAIFLSMLLPYALTLWPLGFLFRAPVKEAAVAWRELVKYAGPVLMTTLGLTLLVTTDIVLVKRFFDPYEAGIYSALSLIGRVVFFASGSITAVMFSLVAEKHAGRERYDNLLLASLGMVGGMSLAITVFYTLFPEFSVRFFFGSKYLSAAPYLWLFGVFISLYSLCYLLANFFLSVRQTTVAFLTFPASLAQLVLIYLFHRSFLDIIEISVAITASLLFVFILFYFRTSRSPAVSVGEEE